ALPRQGGGRNSERPCCGTPIGSGRRLVKGQLGGPLWPQKASPCIGSLRNRARQWQSASAPSSPQRIPAPLSRCPTTLLQADATGPQPVCHPLARYAGVRSMRGSLAEEFLDAFPRPDSLLDFPPTGEMPTRAGRCEERTVGREGVNGYAKRD